MISDVRHERGISWRIEFLGFGKLQYFVCLFILSGAACFAALSPEDRQELKERQKFHLSQTLRPMKDDDFRSFQQDFSKFFVKLSEADGLNDVSDRQLVDNFGSAVLNAMAKNQVNSLIRYAKNYSAIFDILLKAFGHRLDAHTVFVLVTLPESEKIRAQAAIAGRDIEATELERLRIATAVAHDSDRQVRLEAEPYFNHPISDAIVRAAETLMLQAKTPRQQLSIMRAVSKYHAPASGVNPRLKFIQDVFDSSSKVEVKQLALVILGFGTMATDAESRRIYETAASSDAPLVKSLGEKIQGMLFGSAGEDGEIFQKCIQLFHELSAVHAN